MPRYFENALLFLIGRIRTPLPSLSNSSLSPLRTPSIRRTSRGTVICPLLVIVARFCIFTPVPYFIIISLPCPAPGLACLGYRPVCLPVNLENPGTQIPTALSPLPPSEHSHHSVSSRADSRCASEVFHSHGKPILSTMNVFASSVSLLL